MTSDCSPTTTESIARSRRRRLESLRDRFIASTLNTTSLRLGVLRPRSAFDLHRLHALDATAFRRLIGCPGEEGAAHAQVLCDVRADGDMANVAQDLGVLAHAVREQLLEVGTRDLAVGWPFLTGKLRDGTWLRAPLLLFPVELETTQRGRLQWQLVPQGAPVLNWPRPTRCTSGGSGRGCRVRRSTRSLSASRRSPGSCGRWRRRRRR